MTRWRFADRRPRRRPRHHLKVKRDVMLLDRASFVRDFGGGVPDISPILKFTTCNAAPLASLFRRPGADADGDYCSMLGGGAHDDAARKPHWRAAWQDASL